MGHRGHIFKRINLIEIFSGDSTAIYNIRTIIMVFGILLICFIWISIHYMVQNERKMEISNAIKETSNFARAFEEHSLRTIKNSDQSAIFLKYQYEKEGRNIDISQYIKDGRISNHFFVLVSVIDENGDLAASSQVPFVQSNIKDREHFLVHKYDDTGQLFISKPVLGRSSGKWSIQMTRRINKPDGTFGGVVVISMDPYYFTEFYRQVDLGKKSSITLVGLDGIVRARQSGENAEIAQNISQSVLMQKLSESDNGYYTSTSTVDDIKRIYSYRTLPGFPLVVVVGVAEEEVFKELNIRAANYRIVAALVTGAVLFFIIILLGVTTKQRRIGQALKLAHDDLEFKVQQRTTELFKANQELKNEVAERRRTEGLLCKKNEDIKRIAYSDPLTGLPNRAYLNEKLNEEMQKACMGESKGVVLFIDLDDLKMVNDTFGHTSGDALIIAASNNIVEELGNSAFVARIGGDEFIVILPGEFDRNCVAQITDRILGVLRLEHEELGVRFRITASVGIAFYPSDGDTTEEVLKNADNAMYAAKEAGKNCWRFYDKSMQAETYKKICLINSLRYAVERDELLLYYQPQVAVDSKSVIGFEALLRWNSPEHGFISPLDFIPLAEQCGLILPIGEWVLHRACHFVKRLNNIGVSDICVAVNISSKQLIDENFITTVVEALNDAKIKPYQLELEITESVLMVSMEDTIRKLVKLREMGVRLSIDDFGTGYSSLSYLRYLPVDALKIDKSFIDMIANDKKLTEIINSIISMAHALNISVVAEGVETNQQLNYLESNHCDRVQGYIFSKPLPEEEVFTFLEKT